MALKNYTTTVPVSQTVSDIHRELAAHGARKVMFDYADDGKILAICFSIMTPEGERAVRLPGNADRVQKVLQKQRNDPKRKSRTCIDASPEQAERVAWRIVKDWLTAQLAILETEMVDVGQVFLPYFVNRSGQTLYEAYAAGQFRLPD
jgi:hypothetical protein